MKKIYFIGALLATSLSFGQATLPYYEPFNYTAASNLGAQGGWVNVNTGDEVLVEAGNLSYTGLQASLGNSVKFDGGGIDPQQAFTAQTSGIVYSSFIIKVVSVTGVTDPNGGYSYGLADTSTNFASTVWIKPLGAGFQFGINKATATGDTQYLPTEYALNTNYLVVIAYDLGATKASSIWINPTNLGAVSAPASTLTTTTGTTDRTQIQRVFLRQDSATETASVVIDEIRVGTTWAQVTPVPLGVAENNISGLKVYPNPAKSSLFVTSDNFEAKQVEIYNVLGKMVLSTTVTNAPVNVSTLSSGVYMVKVTEEGKTATRKIVIE
ncbi:T9SS type A sorting domain-containing protein [Flavobacterium humi]|uniref:T9SS type A sorting domain-containing protein n=1 Tax=Flavobacterium humi TaxID=2562683 RepID=A0A4Z0L9Z0_9FLAO|nr:T9SS type A sorting domain-containing protein [Flavobacterium humi]TGD58432.1 T9SS type A sorting domain-containing protein [Flavobacterium humi]